MAEINDLNITDASNTARFPEAMAPSAVNDGARALEGLVARWHENINTSIATTGSANAYVLAAKGTQVLFDGLVIGFDANFANTGAATLNVDATGVKNILKHNDVALASGDIEANQKVIVVYDGTSWQMVSPLGNAPGTLSNVVEDTTPQLGGFLDPNSKYIGRAKGGDIASASPLVIDTDGDYFDVTGTTGYAAMTVAANRHFFIQFDGVLTMTHHATNLDLPGEANITTAAGDVGEFFATGSNTVQCVNYTKASGESVVAAAGGGLVFLSSVTLAGAASYDFESLLSSTYDSYLFVFNGVHISGSNSFGAQVSTDNGSAYKGSSGDYHIHALGGDSSSTTDNRFASETHARIPLADEQIRGLDTDSQHAYGGTLQFFDVNSTVHNKFCTFLSGHYDNEGDGALTMGMTMMNSTDNIDAIRFLSNTGTLDEGTIQLYGYAKS